GRRRAVQSRSGPALRHSLDHRRGFLMAPPTSVRRPRRGVRKALRIAGYVLLGIPLVVTTVVLAALLWVRTPSGRAQVRAIVLSQVRKTLPGLDVRAISGNL